MKGDEDVLEAEVRRRLREVLLRQPEDRTLLLKVARVLLAGQEGAGKAEQFGERMRAVLEGLGDQFLPNE